MQFAGLNLLAIVTAAVLAWLIGALWYMTFSKPWVAARGETMESFKQKQAANAGKPAAMTPFILSLLAELVMAWVLAGVLGHLGPGQVTIRNGIVSALFLWVGFVVTTMAVNNTFAGRKPMLLVIDAGHWLLVMVAMGIVIGAFG